ncbi:hypothetical protein F4859DRAFT_511461 [Xylaria cf. heliscus]|nr:hypothetical protein F4859DRAFT_511461 [Xylaria cf. heliscus]
MDLEGWLPVSVPSQNHLRPSGGTQFSPSATTMNSTDLEPVLASQLPSCALTCATQSAQSGACNALTLDCICTNDAYIKLANECIAKSCTIRESLSSTNVTNTLCGITPNSSLSYVPIIIIFLILAILVSLLRAAARVAVHIKVWWDDVCIIFALSAFIGYSGIILSLRPAGFGFDIWAVYPDNVSKILLGQYATGILYTTARYLIRASLLLFYLRIFTTSKARILTICTLVIIVSEGIAFTLPTIFQCSPISLFWEGWDMEHTGHCVNLQSLLWVSIGLGITCDLWMIIFPIAFISRLNLDLKAKLRVSVMFALGILVTALNIARVPALNEFSNTTNATFILSAVENSIGIICASLPSVHGLYKQVRLNVTKFSTEDSFRPIVDGNESRQQSDSGHPVSSESKRVGGGNSAIRMTTTVHSETVPYESDRDVALNDLHLVGPNHGEVGVRAWA